MTNAKQLKLASTIIKPKRKQVKGKLDSYGDPVYEPVMVKIKGQKYEIGKVDVLKSNKGVPKIFALEFPLGLNPRFEELLNGEFLVEEIANLEVEILVENYDWNGNATLAFVYGDTKESKEVYAYVSLKGDSIELSDKSYYDYLPSSESDIPRKIADSSKASSIPTSTGGSATK